MSHAAKDSGTQDGATHGVGSGASFGVFDRDEAFWRKIRELPVEVKMRDDISGMLLFKSKVAQLNRDIEYAIELRLAGWTASLPSGPLEVDRVFAWQWRRPGPRGGRLFLSTSQAITALRKDQGPLALPSPNNPVSNAASETAQQNGPSSGVAL